MNNYNALLKEILETGEDRKGRNGFTRGLFTRQLRFKMSDGFPVVTTKKLAFRSTAVELFFFMSGCTDNRVLQRLGCNIWTENAESDYWKPKAQYPGDLGRIYGFQWRFWQGPDGKTIEQLQNVISTLRNNPHDRRMIVNAWNPGELDMMALPPCHMTFQFHSVNGKLSLHMFQRSCDMFLGVPFNITSYALLLHIIAKIVGQIPDELVLTLGDVHIYSNHFDQVNLQLSRKPFPLPTLWINPGIKELGGMIDVDNIIGPESIKNLVRLENYQYHPAIKADMSV